jgi:hypothetical protein
MTYIDITWYWRCRYLSQYPRLLYFRRLLVEYNKLFDGKMEAWVTAGGPEALVGTALTGARRRALASKPQLAPAHRQIQSLARQHAAAAAAGAKNIWSNDASERLSSSSSTGSRSRWWQHQGHQHFWMFGGR